MTAEPGAIVEHQIRRLLGDRACLASWIDRCCRIQNILNAAAARLACYNAGDDGLFLKECLVELRRRELEARGPGSNSFSGSRLNLISRSSRGFRAKLVEQARIHVDGSEDSMSDRLCPSPRSANHLSTARIADLHSTVSAANLWARLRPSSSGRRSPKSR